MQSPDARKGNLSMSRRIGLVLAVVVAIVALGGCDSGGSGPGANYFPLTPNSTWTYQIASKSQATQFQITDRVIGVKYVPALKVTGSVVDESYSLQRGGTRPLVYYAKDGYIARLSALDYDQKRIQAPSWGRSEEPQFLPWRRTPILTRPAASTAAFASRPRRNTKAAPTPRRASTSGSPTSIGTRPTLA